MNHFTNASPDVLVTDASFLQWNRSNLEVKYNFFLKREVSETLFPNFKCDCTSGELPSVCYCSERTHVPQAWCERAFNRLICKQWSGLGSPHLRVFWGSRNPNLLLKATIMAKYVICSRLNILPTLGQDLQPDKSRQSSTKRNCGEMIRRFHWQEGDEVWTIFTNGPHRAGKKVLNSFSLMRRD